ncbi:hypothetical protein [Micromonospora rifamycinica]|uniref:hypothetical protein n=1 Tax=Micromonospora rifamycinica TaxID=291594 RepID=UPI0018D5423A|nr:hypothetical protein [Micromonospora rifamycinica]
MNGTARHRPPRADLIAAGAAVGLVAVAVVVGGVLYLTGRPVHASAAPLFAQWLPHVGPGTPLAVLLAVLVWWRGPATAARLTWRPLLALSYATAVAWTLSLALVDGWQRGVAGRLTTEFEYLHEVPGVTDIPAMLAGFAGRILDQQPDSWTTHVSGHPPGALLVFVLLDRAGLGGGGWAGMLCVLAAGLVAVAVPHTVRLLGTDEAARAVVPFVVLFPGAVWSGVSADGLFAGVTATGVALVAHGAVRGRAVGAVAGGTLLALGCYLSYGLVLMAPIALVVVVLAGWRWRKVGGILLGAVPVVVAFTAVGFWWPTGYHLVIERYYQGVASDRAYGYWVWANLALVTVAAGPVAAVIVRRAVPAAWRDVAWRRPVLRRPVLRRPVLRRPVLRRPVLRRPVLRRPVLRRPVLRRPVLRRPVLRRVVSRRVVLPEPGLSRPVLSRSGRFQPGADPAGWLLVLAATAVILAADLSGYSKAEVERIWLPFTVWLMAGAALIPPADRRGWLAVQAAVALTVNHLLLTGW